MLFSFTNRRRAKDAIMTLVDNGLASSTEVFVQEGAVYISTGAVTQDITTIMHFADHMDKSKDEVFDMDELTEYYSGEGLTRFRA